MASVFDISKPDRTLRIGVILTGGTTEILDVAPVDLLSSISQKIHEFPDELFPPGMKKQAINIEFHWVNEHGDTANLTAGLRIQATDSFRECPPLDIVLMGANNRDYQPNERELDFVRKSYNDCFAFIAICGGSQAAMQAGLFKGKTVTAPLPVLDLFENLEPEAKFVRKRWQRDGKLWTSGTLLNGLDLMRAFGEQTFGGEGTLMGNALKKGHWPRRDVNYSDVEA